MNIWEINENYAQLSDKYKIASNEHCLYDADDIFVPWYSLKKESVYIVR